MVVGTSADQLKRGGTKMAAKELPNRKKRNRLWSIFPSVMAPILHWSHFNTKEPNFRRKKAMPQ